MLIDTHCHLDFKDFDHDRKEVISRLREEGITSIINVGSSLKGTKDSIELAERNEVIFAAAGIHPHEADNIKDSDLELFKDSFNSKKVVAVGEIGLDYYKNISSKDNQKKLFIRLLQEAKKRDLPIIIHNRDAHKDIMMILKDVMGGSIKGVMHCFSGDERLLEECLGLGLFISFTCNLTFKNASRLREIAKIAPIDKLLLETDAPFLAPQAFRGRRNEPSYVKYLAEELSRIKGLELEEVAKITSSNAKKLFDPSGSFFFG